MFYIVLVIILVIFLYLFISYRDYKYAYEKLKRTDYSDLKGTVNYNVNRMKKEIKNKSPKRKGFYKVYRNNKRLKRILDK